ncbi:hypothetical protein D3C78_1531990 [compost metagenome]
MVALVSEIENADIKYCDRKNPFLLEFERSEINSLKHPSKRLEYLHILRDISFNTNSSSHKRRHLFMKLVMSFTTSGEASFISFRTTCNISSNIFDLKKLSSCSKRVFIPPI